MADLSGATLIDTADIAVCRTHLDRAVAELQSACELLTAAGLTEWSTYLGVDAARIAVWTQPDGILDCFEWGCGDG